MPDLHTVKILTVVQMFPVFCYLIGLARIRFGNGDWGWYGVGTSLFYLLIWFMDDFADIMTRDSHFTYDDYVEAARAAGFVILCSVFFVTIFYFLTKHAINRRDKRLTAQKEQQTGKDTQTT